MINNEHKTSIKKGLFISFEGGEGVGKSTQINLLKKFLSKKSYKVTSTREPGRKARMVFKSTVKPPLTLPLMSPVTTSFFS